MGLAVVTTFAREISGDAEAFLHTALCSSHGIKKRSTWQKEAAQCGTDTSTETNLP